MTLHDEIEAVAYDLFESRGRCHGRDFDDWLNAEEIVLERHAGQEIEEPEEEEEMELVAVGTTLKKSLLERTDENGEYINEEMS